MNTNSKNHLEVTDVEDLLNNQQFAEENPPCAELPIEESSVRLRPIRRAVPRTDRVRKTAAF